MGNKIKKSDIVVGNVFKCIKDVIMEDGSKYYSKGLVYISQENDCITNDEGDKYHKWTENSINDHFELFKNENTDVYIYGHPESGAEVIKMLEDKGGANTGNNSGVFEDYIYLINPDDNSITCFNVSSLSILKLGRTELKPPEIKEVKEPEFKPFERVLVRDEDDEFWQVSLYSHYASEHKGFEHGTVGGYFAQC